MAAASGSRQNELNDFDDTSTTRSFLCCGHLTRLHG